MGQTRKKPQNTRQNKPKTNFSEEVKKLRRREIRNPHVRPLQTRPGSNNVYHQYVIHSDRRDELMNYLKENDIGTIIHYPIPPHLQKAYEYLGYRRGDFPIAEKYADEVLSLPMYNGMTEEEQDYVIDKINSFK